jgi:hypothetical protein
VIVHVLQHWRFRLDNPVIALSTPQFYEVTGSTPSIQLLGDETSCSLADGAMFIVKTPLETFVIVTPSARGNGKGIAMALKAAETMIQPNPRQGVPFRPTVHALVLPSLIPRDLQATLRSSILDDLVSQVMGTYMKIFTLWTRLTAIFLQNAPHQPTTMNVVDLATAWEHLGRDHFYKSEILDMSLLPVGVSPEMIRGM